MSFPRYPTYKDSGVEWLGEVPEHWGTSRVRWLCNRYAGGTPDKTRVEYWENGTIPWLSSGAVNDRRITDPTALITEEAFANSSAKWIPPGAILMALAGQGKTKGMVAQLAFMATCNQSMAALVPGSRIDSRFLYWWLESNYQNIRNMAGGDLRDGLNLELIGNIQCPLPAHTEQATISGFLDRETAKIDALIAEQQRLIELLQEKRQAVISHAVTKGLNPDAPMKDSGVEWLGEVPEHWPIKPIKYLASKASGGTPAKDNLSYWQDGDVPWASSKDLKADQINDTQDHLTPLAISEGAAQLQPLVSVFICVRGMILAHTFPVTEPLRPMAINQDLKCLVPTKEMSSGYLALCLRGLSSEILRRVDEAAHGTKVLRVFDFDSVLIPVPPLTEQTQILMAIASSRDHLDSLISQASRSMELLSERRSALISAAVTGQIDVRGLVPMEAAA